MLSVRWPFSKSLSGYKIWKWLLRYPFRPSSILKWWLICLNHSVRTSQTSQGWDSITSYRQPSRQSWLIFFSQTFWIFLKARSGTARKPSSISSLLPLHIAPLNKILISWLEKFVSMGAYLWLKVESLSASPLASRSQSLFMDQVLLCFYIRHSSKISSSSITRPYKLLKVSWEELRMALIWYVRCFILPKRLKD